MNEIFQNIQNAKHIEIIVQADFMGSASALYTYILTLHKKVSMVYRAENIDKKFSFLPWFEKIKSSDIPSADLSIICDFSAKSLYEVFQINAIKLNKKMATALYGALIYETQGFKKGVDGTTFAMAEVLIACGAAHTLCVDAILQNTSLAFLRLQSIMFRNMFLQNCAKAAVFTICEEELKATGANMEDAYKIMQEAFKLEYVEMVVLLDSDHEYEIIKVKYKEK
ncbi:MAG TPA: phosphoesterase [Sulfurimonas sp. UBA12504]|nr:MAG: phosphoesterase [Sulfurimonas sp. GWF2_37_8]DAB30806.1 MAG TPA: phosphoesterase [Sulfurimonas sp. UBA12504]